MYYITDENAHTEEHSIEEINQHYAEHKKWISIQGKFSTIQEVVDAYHSENVDIKNRILLKTGDEHIVTTVGRAIFNSYIPEKVRYINEKVGSK